MSQTSVVPPVPASVSADPIPPVAVMTSEPLLDYNSAEAKAVLDGVLTDWFTSPDRRESALSLLVDPMAGPFDGSRPALKQVVVDSRTVPGSYSPNIPGVQAVVANGMDRAPLEVGELGVCVQRFAVMSDGSVTVAFSQRNHGYLGKWAVYATRKSVGVWRAELVSED